jgi:hypothetical protein
MVNLARLLAVGVLLSVIVVAGCAGGRMPSPVAAEAPGTAGGSTGHQLPAVQPAPKSVADLVAQLGNADFAKRQEALKALVEAGAPAVALLQAAAKDKDPERAARAAQALREIADRQWGEAVEGVQLALRTDRRQWKPGEIPVFRIEARNTGTQQWFVPEGEALYQLTLGGESYWKRHVPEGRFSEGPGRTRLDPDRKECMARVTLAGWLRVGDNKPMDLPPGTYTVQVRCTMELYESVTVTRKKELVSSPIVVEILPAPANP